MLVLGIDASTTAVKTLAWDAEGDQVAQGRAAFPLSNPEPLAWEQDAESWWSALRVSIAECVRSLAGRAEEIRALAITHQRETFVLTNESGAALAPALVWMDSRGSEQVERLVARLGRERLRDVSGKPPCITPSFYKLAHLFARRPELARAEPRLHDVHSFLVQRLTGRFATSLASADPLGLVDMTRRTWSAELAAEVGLTLEQLPALVEQGEVIGEVQAEVAKVIGLPNGLPVVAGAGDGQAAGLGAGISAPGRAYLNLGTAIVSGVLSSSYRTSDAFRTLYAAAPGTFFLETDLKGGTFTLDWLAERLLGATDPNARLAELELEAGKLAAGADGLLLVPYWNGVMNPYWDDDATGVVLGLTGRHGPAHLYRAVLEGIAFEQRVHTTGVETATATPVHEMVVMGGGSRSDLFCQILADVLERPIVRARSSEATALGAGILAAARAGMHPNVELAAARMTGTDRRFVPGPSAERYRELYASYRQIYPALRTLLARTSRLTRAGANDG